MAARADKAAHTCANDTLGRLSALGPRAAWQTAFVLPASWKDLRNIHRRRLPRQPDVPVFVLGRIEGSPNRGRDAPPRLRFTVRVGRERVGVVLFGNLRSHEARLRACDGWVLVGGELVEYGGRLYLRGAQLLDTAWAGRLMPVYRGKKGVMGADTLRIRIMDLLDEAAPKAAAWLRYALGHYGDEAQLLRLAGATHLPSLEQLIRCAHLPGDEPSGVRAQRALERLAALRLIDRARANLPPVCHQAVLLLGDWRERAKQLPFALSADQVKSVDEIIGDMASNRPMRRFLSGDVGTGKTAVYALAAVAVADAGERAYILLPSTVLAEQVHTFIATHWPEVPLHRLAGSNGDRRVPAGPLVLVGTTAMLHRELDAPALLVIDEQHKFSRDQREQLVGERTHVLEATATCIPRSQALVQYGVVAVSRLRTAHVRKTIHTRLWTHKRRKALFASIRTTLSGGDQVLVLYPKREAEDGDSANKTQRHAATEMMALWDKAFPGQAVLVHGGQDSETNERALERMRSAEAAILVATTVVEVGVDLPGLRRVVIVHADRFGLSALHQIRGRVARTGGHGWCDLYLPREASEQALNRLSVLVRTQDGFRVAHEDLKQRGFGDLSRGSARQTGSAASFLFGRDLDPEVVERMLQEVR